MAGFWIGLVLIVVVMVVVACLCAGVYLWMHDGRASLWEDAGETVREIREETRRPELRDRRQTGDGYVRTEVRSEYQRDRRYM